MCTTGDSLKALHFVLGDNKSMRCERYEENFHGAAIVVTEYQVQ